MAIEIATAFVQVVPSMKGVGKAIESAFGSASETAGNTAGIKAGNGFAGGFGAKLGVITGIAQSVAGKAIEAFMGLSGEITSASDSAQKFASTLNFAGVSEKQIKRLTASTQDYADKTVYDLNDIRNTTAQLAANGVPNYDRLAEAAGNLNAVAGGSADTFKSVAMVLTQTAGQGKLTTENWNQLSDAIPGASGKIQQALKEAGAYTGNFRDAISGVWTSVWNAVKSVASTIWNAISGVVSTYIQNVRNAISTVLNAISGVWTSVWNSVSSFLGNIWHGITSAVSNGIQSVSNTVGRIRDTVLGAVSGAGGWLYDTGRQIISGLINGIGGAFQWVRNTISNLGSSLVGWAKGVLGIHSPSRIFRDEVGKWIPAGMAQGIDKASGLVADSIDGLTDMIPTVSLKTDTSRLETPLAYHGTVNGGRIAYTMDDRSADSATKQDIIDAIDMALSAGITLNLSDRGGEVMAGKLAKPMSYELDNMARLGR